MNKTYCCAALLLYNFADLKWQHVSCRKSQFKIVPCMIPKEKHTVSQETESQPPPAECDRKNIFHSNWCFHFKWQKQSEIHKCFHEITIFQHLFAAVATIRFLPIFNSLESIVEAVRHFNVFTYKMLEVTGPDNEAVCIYPSLPQNESLTGNIFLCGESTYISAQYACDAVSDCPGKLVDDEVYCECKFGQTTSTQHSPCTSDIQKPSVCSPLYYQTHTHKCLVYVFEEPEVIHEKTRNVTKNSLNSSLDKNKIFNNTNKSQMTEYLSCSKKYQLPCSGEKDVCFNVTQICTFTLDGVGKVSPCKMGDHIQECADFKCNMMFKCPFYYCIHWKYVCDGKWDCPIGSDESSIHKCGETRPCSLLFKCRRHQVCIHIDKVCNNQKDCPLGDDEALCALKTTICPNMCKCLTFAVHCTTVNITQSFVNTMSEFRIFSYEHSLTSFVLVTTRGMVSLVIRHTYIQSFCKSIGTGSRLKLLDVQFSSIFLLSGDCFKGLRAVSYIRLSRARIIVVSRFAFHNLIKLKYLNISNNPLKVVKQNFLSKLPTLKLLSIVNISFQRQQIYKSLENIPFQYLETKEYLFCCQKKNVAQCSTELPWFVSCTDLLINYGIKVACWIISSITVLSNVTCITLYTFVYRKELNKSLTKASTNNLMVIAINIVDTICSLPLIILWIEDILYEGIYVMNDQRWKSSSTCYSVSGLFLLFNYLSPVLLGLLAFSRLSIVQHPVESKFKETSFVKKILITTICTFIFLATLFTIIEWAINVFVQHSSIPLSVCSPFVDPGNKLWMIKIFTWTVAIFQNVFIVGILVIYILLVRSLEASQEKLKDSVSKQHTNKMLIAQIFIVSSSNIISWFPCSIIFLVSMFLQQYPIRMMVWIIVSVNPMNSIVNPLVFLFMICRKIFS